MDFDGGARETASSLSQRCQKFWNAKCVETNKIANTNLAQFAAVDFEHRVVFQNRASLFFSVFFSSLFSVPRRCMLNGDNTAAWTDAKTPAGTRLKARDCSWWLLTRFGCAKVSPKP